MVCCCCCLRRLGSCCLCGLSPVVLVGMVMLVEGTLVSLMLRLQLRSTEITVWLVLVSLSL